MAVFCDVDAIWLLQATIYCRIEETKNDPEPLVRTAGPDKIITTVKPEHRILGSIHYTGIVMCISAVK